jgi:hypothetical protein
MAMWRKPAEEQTLAYLLEFDTADLVSWRYLGVSAWQRWSDARFEWLLKHRDRTLNGKNAVGVIFEEP